MIHDIFGPSLLKDIYEGPKETNGDLNEPWFMFWLSQLVKPLEQPCLDQPEVPAELGWGNGLSWGLTTKMDQQHLKLDRADVLHVSVLTRKVPPALLRSYRKWPI